MNAKSMTKLQQPISAEQAESFLRALFEQALRAVRPELCLPPIVSEFQRSLYTPPRRTIVIGAGKAAAAMAATLEQEWQAGPLEGLVITRYGHLDPTFRPRQIRVIEASHPVPDAVGQQAAQECLQLVQGLSSDDLVICLWSGGGSALMSLPAPGVSLEEKQALNRALLRCGATIHEINAVRKHLSAIKGGRLALACSPARVHSFVISDVAGDDLSVIASGPTVPDASTSQDALAILQRYHVPYSASLQAYLESAASETPKQFPPELRSQVDVIASAQTALDAAGVWASTYGVDIHILSDRLQGEARELGREHAALALEMVRSPLDRPQLILSGGETTVQVKGTGRGGRNTEYLLSCAIHLQGHPQIFALAADSDGIDGSEDNAGAWIGPQTAALAQELGLHAEDYLECNDAYGFFQSLNALLLTGPTMTNVNDFRALLILPR